VIEEGQRKGLFRKTFNAQIVSKVLFGALDEMVTNWVLSKKRYNLISTADPVIDLFVNGIAAE